MPNSFYRAVGNAAQWCRRWAVSWHCSLCKTPRRWFPWPCPGRINRLGLAGIGEDGGRPTQKRFPAQGDSDEKAADPVSRACASATVAYRRPTLPTTPSQEPPRPRRAGIGAEKKITAVGTIEPEQVVDIGAQVTGTIASFGADPHEQGKSIDYGSAVEAGTVLSANRQRTVYGPRRTGAGRLGTCRG